MVQLLIAANLTLIWNHPFANIVAGMQASLKSSQGTRSPIEIAQDIFGTSGLPGFWFGLPLSIVLSGSNATMLYFYEVFSALFDRTCARIPSSARIFSAAMLIWFFMGAFSIFSFSTSSETCCRLWASFNQGGNWWGTTRPHLQQYPLQSTKGLSNLYTPSTPEPTSELSSALRFLRCDCIIIFVCYYIALFVYYYVVTVVNYYMTILSY